MEKNYHKLRTYEILHINSNKTVNLMTDTINFHGTYKGLIEILKKKPNIKTPNAYNVATTKTKETT